jgi:uncharacterized membrane protein YjjP (DUF1212 family)
LSDTGATRPPRVPTRITHEVLALEFLGDAGKLMLESSPSVSEVIEQLRRMLPALGLHGCQIDATLSMLTLSYWQRDLPAPLTTMRAIMVSDPQLARLTSVLTLLDEVEAGELDLKNAARRLRAIEDAPARSRPYARAAILLSVAGWVMFLKPNDVLAVLVAVLATLLTFPVGTLVGRLRMPAVFGTFLAAAILAAVPNLLAGAGLKFAVGPAVVGGLYVYLPGRAIVSSVIDWLSSAPVSSIARGFEALLTAGALALGILVGGKIGAGLGVNATPDPTTKDIAPTVIAAGIGILGLAIAWGMPRRRLLPVALIACAGWLIVALASHNNTGSVWLSFLIAAVVVGFLGVVVAALQGGTATLYTGVAIVPLVPGFALYRSMLGLVQGRHELFQSSLETAIGLSLAIAGGVAIGIAAGRNVFSARQVLGSRMNDRRKAAAADTRWRRSHDPPQGGTVGVPHDLQDDQKEER